MNLRLFKTKHPKARKGARGTSLIESMTALGILAVGLMGFTTAIVAALGQDRRNDARAAAQALATELARDMATWRFNDPRLTPVNSYTGLSFTQPQVTAFNVSTKPTLSAPGVVTETLVPPPDYRDATSLGAYAGTDLSVINRLPNVGSTYLFRRYWNVTVDPSNDKMKLIAVHVTYSASTGRREVVTAYQTVFNVNALVSGIGTR
jgi:hypothetical protein